MATTIVDSNNHPSYSVTPDMRFGTTMISNKYRDYAVDGEAIMDKVSGEIFIKRPADGRVISFHQNKKYVHDLVLELRVLMSNNMGFKYPHDNESGYFISTDYDVTAINDETPLNMLNAFVDCTNEDGIEKHHMKFNISNESNGFFCKPITRDTDKIIVEYMTNQYNTLVENYTEGSNIDLINEKTKMQEISTWKDSNVELVYKATVTSQVQGISKSYTATSYIRLNEECCVYLPVSEFLNDFVFGYDNIDIEILSLKTPKFDFLSTHTSILPETYETEMKKFGSPDDEILLNNVNVMNFVDSSENINLNGNEFLIAMLDIPYVNRYMVKLAKLHDKSEVLQSIERPTEVEWTANNIWIEHLRDVSSNGNVTFQPSETNLKALESFLAKKANGTVITGIIQTDEGNIVNYYAKNKE